MIEVVKVLMCVLIPGRGAASREQGTGRQSLNVRRGRSTNQV